MMWGTRTAVLLVEIDPIVLDTMHGLLTGEQYQVDAASTFADAEALMDADPVDLLIIDMGLPGHGAERLVQKAAERDVPYLLTSGTIQQIALVDSTGHHAKAEPFDPDAFLAHVGQLLRPRATT